MVWMERIYKGGRLSGRFKAAPEDFIVEEITETGRAIELSRSYTAADLGMSEGSETSRFSVFVLQKRQWNTNQALRAVAKRLGRGIRSVGFAGTKDRNAVTTQLCSIFGAAPGALMSLHIKDISINGAWRADSAIEMGALRGNRFAITVRDVSNEEKLNDALAALDGRFPNYFGPQRFGVRGNNAEIGALILKGDFEEAVRVFLTDTANELSADAIEARRRLAEEWDFGAAVRYFPKYLKYELQVIEYLSRFPGNYANALRRLPRSLLLMFVHALEAKIFNAELEERVRSGMTTPMPGDVVCDNDALGFPDYATACRFDGSAHHAFIVSSVVGYNTDLNDVERNILDNMGLPKDAFKAKGMPEINAKGSQRAMFAPYAGMEHSSAQDYTMLRFSLPSGSYATVLLGELVESESNAEPSEDA